MTRSSTLSDLMAVIAARKANPETQTSYVARLMNGGVPTMSKILEEAAEVVQAGDEPGDDGRLHLVKEVADLVFHSMVLLGYRDLAWDDVETELARRSGVSGIAGKEAPEAAAAPVEDRGSRPPRASGRGDEDRVRQPRPAGPREGAVSGLPQVRRARARALAPS